MRKSLRQAVGRRRATGHTMVELLLSLATATILMVGLASTLYVAAQSISPSMVGPAIVSSAQITEDILSELQLAIGFTERSATAVTFSVADRDDDGDPESIRYSWAGTDTDSLVRKYNDGVEQDVLTNAQDFQLTYDVLTESSGEPPATDRYYVKSVTVALQPIESIASRIQGATEVRDRPEVSAP